MLLVVFLLSIWASVVYAQGQLPSRIAFTNVTLVDGTDAQARAGMTVLVAGNRIETIAPTDSLTLGPGVRIVDARHKYLIPGLFDTHVHFFVWFMGSADTTAAAMRGAGVYLANGITTLIDVAGQRNREEPLMRVRAAVQASGRPIPRIHLSGRVDSLAVNRARAPDAGELADRLLADDIIGIKIHRGLDQADLRAVVAAAKRAGRLVYGHTYELRPTGIHDYTREAVEAGVDGLFHVMGIAPVRPTREPTPPASTASSDEWWLYGATRWLYVDTASADSLILLMVKQGTWLQPTLVTEELLVNIGEFWIDPAWRYAPPGSDPELTGIPRFGGTDLARYREAYQRMKWFVRRFYDAGGMVIAGTDGVRIPGFGLQDELRLLVEAGLPPLAALQAATRNAARAFRLDGEVGTIEPGKRADLVLLDADPLTDIHNTRRIAAVLIDGVFLDRHALDALLAAVERPVPNRR